MQFRLCKRKELYETYFELFKIVWQVCPKIELPLLYRGYCNKFMVFRKELEMQKMLGRLLHVWACFRSRQGFPGRDKVFWFCVVTWLSGLK